MDGRLPVLGGALAAAVAGVLALPLALEGQSPTPKPGAAARATAAPKAYSAPRTPWGDPDFQGIWSTDHFGQHVDLERPPELAGKSEVTAEEAEARRVAEAIVLATGNAEGARGTLGTYGREWRDTEFSKFKPSTRTSLIVVPPDGRLPERTAEGKARAAARRQPRPIRSHQDLPLGLRCIRGFPGVMMPIGYNNNKQIVQGPGYVTILYEMNHDMRIIPLDGRPHVGPKLRGYFGDSRGRWEGDTLVVEITNFSGKGDFQGTSEHLRVVERFRRTSADELDYQFSMEDPATFTRPWTVSMPWLRDDSQYEIYEYACHEGNQSLANTLSGARAEADAKKGSK